MTQDEQQWLDEIKQFFENLEDYNNYVKIQREYDYMSHDEFKKLEKKKNTIKVKPKVDIIDKDKYDWLFNGKEK